MGRIGVLVVVFVLGLPIGSALAGSGPHVKLAAAHRQGTVRTRVTLRVGVTGTMPNGSKLQLRVRRPGAKHFVTGATLHLHGGHASVTVSSSKRGKAAYQVVLVSAHGAVLASSGTVTITWKPGGPAPLYFSLLVTGSSQGEAYSDLSLPNQTFPTCSLTDSSGPPGCVGVTRPGEGLTLNAHLGSDIETTNLWGTLPAGWKITLKSNGAALPCTLNAAANSCTGSVVVPATGSQLPLSGVLTTATGKTFTATVTMEY